MPIKILPIGLKCQFPLSGVLYQSGLITIEESVWYYQAKLAIPAFTKSKDQLGPVDVEKTRGKANVRINVERVIGLLLRQKYTILQSTLPIDFLLCDLNEPESSRKPLVDKTIRVCAALVNLCPPLIPFD